MAGLGTVVHARIGTQEHLLVGRELRDLGLCGRVAEQLAGDNPAWSLRAGGKHALEEAFRCKLVAHPFLESVICVFLFASPGAAVRESCSLVEATMSGTASTKPS